MTGRRRAAEAVRPSTLAVWYRAGLAAGVGAVLCALAVLGLAVARDGDLGAAGALLLPAFVGALVALGFLQRVWSDPAAAGDPQVGRALRWAHVVEVTWALAVVVSFAVRLAPDGLDWLRWAAVALYVVAVAAFVAMLALAARWRPVR